MIVRTALVAGLLLLPASLLARPVSHPGGTTVLTEINPMQLSAHVHYSPSRHWSVGPRIIHLREEDRSLFGVQATWLARRWNMPAAQANLYVAGMAAAAERADGPAMGGGMGPAGLVDVQADWENRRLMLMGMVRVMAVDRMATRSMQMGRIGWAPYAGGYGDVHLWLFGQVRHDALADDALEPALVARIFYRTMLLEAGVTDRGGLIVNSTLRF